MIFGPFGQELHAGDSVVHSAHGHDAGDHINVIRIHHFGARRGVGLRPCEQAKLRRVMAPLACFFSRFSEPHRDGAMSADNSECL